MEGDLLYSKFTDLNVNLIQNTLSTATFRLVFDQSTGHNDLAKLTHKINHHSWVAFNHFFFFCPQCLLIPGWNKKKKWLIHSKEPLGDRLPWLQREHITAAV